MTDAERERAAEWARSVVSAPWFTGAHKRPPFRAHSFDNDGCYWAEGKPEDVKAYCPRCQRYAPVDLDRLVREKGPEYSLINRRPHCSITPGCEGRISFHVRHGVFRVLRDR